MNRLSNLSVPFRLLLVLVLISLLGLSARPHAAGQELDLAQRALEAGAYSQAALHLELAAGRMPAWASRPLSSTDVLALPGIQELAGHYALLGGDSQAAICNLLLAPQDSLTAQGLTDLGDAYQQVGNWDAAGQSWQKAALLTGPSLTLSSRLLQAHRQLGDFPAAIADLQTLVDLQPGDASLRYQLGLLTATQTPEVALASLRRAVEMDPTLKAPADSLRHSVEDSQITGDRAYTLLAAGRTLASLNEWDLAGEAFRQATLARPDYAEAWAYLGEARQHVQPGAPLPVDDGLPEIRKALALDPRSVSANLFLSLYWQRQNKYDLALQTLQAAADQEPLNPAIQAGRGDILAARGDLEPALEAYQQALSAAHGEFTYLAQLINFSLTYGYQVRQVALPAARQAVIASPHDPAALDLMAQVLIHLNDQASARRFLDQALQSGPGYARAHLHLGLVYLFQGNNSQAYQELQLARNLAEEPPVADQSQRLLKTYFP
ncbi:MAG TPA: tetratricopeptide repeat protein [Anaerolineales bacterium]